MNVVVEGETSQKTNTRTKPRGCLSVRTTMFLRGGRFAVRWESFTKCPLNFY